MAYVLAERVRERTLTTGTGPLSLAGIINPNERTFVAGVGSGNHTRYCLLSGNGVDWEIGENALVTAGTPDTLARAPVLSTNANAAISLIGDSRVFVCLPAMVPFSSGGNWAADVAYPQNSVVRFGEQIYIASTFIPAAPSGAPVIDGSAKHNGSSGSGATTLNLTTTNPNDWINVLVAVGSSGQTATPTAPGLTFTERGRFTSGGFKIQHFTAFAAAPLSSKVITITPSASADFSAVAFGVSGANITDPFDTKSSSVPAGAAGNTVNISTDGDREFLIYADMSATIGFNETTVPTSFTLIQGNTYVPAQMGVSARSVAAQQTGVSLVGSASNAVLSYADALTSGNAPPSLDSRWVALGQGFPDQAANKFYAGPTSGADAPPAFRLLVPGDYPTMVGDSGSGGVKGALSAPAAGDAAAGKYANAGGGWSVPPGSGSATLAGLSDVVITSVANNDFIAYNSGTSKYTNRTATAVTALLTAFVGDSGSGGTKGLVPAPASGDAAAQKYLAAGGGWSVPSGSGPTTFAALADVALTSIADNDFPVYASGSSKFTNRTLAAIRSLLTVPPAQIAATFDSSTSTVAGITGCYAGAAAIAASCADGDAYEFRAVIKKGTGSAIAIILTNAKNATHGYFWQIQTDGNVLLATDITSLRASGSSVYPNNAGWICIAGTIVFTSAGNNFVYFPGTGLAPHSNNEVNFVGNALWCGIRGVAGSTSADVGKVMFTKINP